MTANRLDVLDETTLRTAFGAFPSGVVAVAAMLGGQPIGMSASSFTSISLVPPLVSVSTAHTSTTWPKLRGLPRLGVSVLSAGQDDVCRALASKHAPNRFADVTWSASVDGAVFVEGAALWLDCVPYSEIDAGDHKIVLLEVTSVVHHDAVEPLVFHRSRFRTFAREPGS